MNHYVAKVAQVFTCASVLGLAGCGSHDVDLAGVKIGMTRGEVAAVAPAGATVYCQGEGDAQFEKDAGLPPSVGTTWCTWASSMSGGRSAVPVTIGSAPSSKLFLVFGADGRIVTATIETPSKDYDSVVKNLKDKYGSPDTNIQMGGVTWKEKNGTLDVSGGQNMMGDQPTIILLKHPDAQAAS